MATDPIDPAARARLNEAMEERRADLGLRWREVAAAAGDISTEGLRNIRFGPSGIPPFRRRALERALRWPRYEVDRILGETAVPHEWSAEERLQMRSMSLDEAIEFGRKLKDGQDEHAAVVWMQEWAKERDGALSPEDSPQ
jgi:hypothetical protein